MCINFKVENSSGTLETSSGPMFQLNRIARDIRWKEPVEPGDSALLNHP
jgi:hypothetical protein